VKLIEEKNKLLSTKHINLIFHLKKKKNIKNIFNFYTIKQKFFIKMSNKNKLLNIILKSHIFQNAILLLFLQKI